MAVYLNKESLGPHGLPGTNDVEDDPHDVKVFTANPTVRGIQQLRKNSIQTTRDIADVLRHIIKNISERLFGNIQSPAPVTQWECFCFF